MGVVDTFSIMAAMIMARGKCVSTQELHNNAHSSVCYAWPMDLLTSHILPQTRLYGRQKSFEGYQRKSFSDGEHKKLFFEVIKELNQKVSNKPIGECMLVGG